MVDFRPLDSSFPIEQKLGVDAESLVPVNVFTVDPSDQKALGEAWRSDALWMKKQPGYISAQLDKAIGNSSMYLNYAFWDSVAEFHAAFSNPEFQNALRHHPSSAVTSPNLCEKTAVPNCCVA